MRTRRRLRMDDVTVVDEGALKKAVWGSVVGNFMEWYDVGVYGYVAVILGRVFLPDASGTVQNLFSLGVFAVTFVARPLGGIILGQLGDRLGRKQVLAFTLLMMAAATFLIGVLPTYGMIGALAPALLIVLKLAQGFSTGGEYAGATTFITEYAPDKKRGFYSSLLDLGSYLGFAAGAAVVAGLQLSMSEAAMYSWGWRIPFLISLPLGVIALYFRTHIEDTPAFIDAQAQADGPEGPDGSTPAVTRVGDVEDAIIATENGPLGLVALVKSFWREILVVMVLVAAANTVAYGLTSYMPTYLSTTLGYDAVHGNLLTLPVLVVLALLVPLSGWLGDHIGRRKVAIIAALTGLVGALPAFLLMGHGQVWSTILGLLCLVVPVFLFVGNQSSSLPAMFPTHSRYGGMGLSYNIAVAAFGGTAGLIMEALVASTGNKLAPAYWIMGMSLAGLAAAIRLKESARQPMLGSMPSVATEDEAQELVATQEENPDLDVEQLFATAPVSVIAQEPTIEDAQREVAVAEAAEQEAREALRRAELYTADARRAEQAAIERAATAEVN